MKKTLLRIEKLKVKGDKKEILKGIDFQMRRGEVRALLGPNGSGKTVFSQTILGDPKYKVTKGKIFFEGKDITKFPPEKRVKLGMALVWQSPPVIKGVKLSTLLKKISKETIEIKETRELLDREINLDFSGGEKKMSELLQVIHLSSKLVIFDEIDSGLDIEKAEQVAKIIKKEFIDKKISILLITHWGQILKFLRPHWTSVMLGGKIICKSKDYKKVLEIIKKYGYEKCKECPLLAGRPQNKKYL